MGVYTQLMNNVIVEYSYYTWLYVTVCSVILSTIMLGSLKVTVHQLIMHSVQLSCIITSDVPVGKAL